VFSLCASRAASSRPAAKLCSPALIALVLAMQPVAMAQ
jgi:hypothetical protein